jgi:glyoxylase-like metal-dependent hydrolase (beta-lactamase superfamily II)
MDFRDIEHSKIHASCPFSIQKIQRNRATASTTYLIREHDQYGEYPHIYAKICTAEPSSHRPHSPAHRHCDSSGYLREMPMVIVLSDTGCGTEVRNSAFPFAIPSSDIDCYSHRQPRVWNIRTFLEFTLNPDEKIPYLVMTTHCHYDHILGVGKLPPTSLPSTGRPPHPTTVLSSSHAKSFVLPYSHLQRHSLCEFRHLHAPKYDVGIWADDMSGVEYTPTPEPSSSSLHSPSSSHSVPTPYIILHTPGHTPDSLSWYDSELRLLCVGDSFYAKETQVTKSPSWGREPSMPVIFSLEGDVKEWWESLEKVLKFVRERNGEVEKTVEGRVPGSGDARTKEGLQGLQNRDKEDEGFVLINVAETNGEEEAGEPPQTENKQSSKATNPPRPASEVQDQTSFSIPPPDERELTAHPSFTTSSPLKTASTTTHSSNPSSTPFHPFGPPLNSEISRRRTENLRGPPGSDSWVYVQNRKSNHKPQTHDQSPPAAPPQATIPSAADSEGPSPGRVFLCAAHTTLALDAEEAILAMRTFIMGVLRDEVPCKRLEDGLRGEERWLWDFALRSREERSRVEGEEEQKGRGSGIGPVSLKNLAEEEGEYAFSVLAPLRVIEEGRRKIPLDLDLDGKIGMGGGPVRGGVRGPAGVV